MKRFLIIAFLFICYPVSAQQKWTVISILPGGCSAFDPYFLNENYGFNGCTSLARTTDGGKTWMQVGNFGPVYQIIFDTPSHLYGNRGDAIFESLDSGLTWHKISTFMIAGDIYVSNGVIYLASGVRSYDNGQTWITDLSNFVDKNYTIIGNKEKGVASFSNIATFDEGTLYSTDAGNSWQVGQPKDECYNGYAVPHTLTYFRSSEITYLGYGKPANNYSTQDSNVILRSKDGGATWQKVFPNFPPPCWLSSGIGGGGCSVFAQSHYKDPGIDNTVLGGVWRSTDLGNTWDSIGGPANNRDTRISVVSRGAICYANDMYDKLWKFTDSSLLRNATWDISLKRTSVAISNDTLYAKTCDSAQITLNYGFTSCDYVKLDTISVEGIPRSDYRVDFIKDKVIMEGRADTSGITFTPSIPGTYHIKVHTFVMRDDWVREDTAFSLVLVVSPNPAKLNLTPEDSLNFGTQTLCNLHPIRDTIHLSNTGCDALTITSITLETDAGAKNEFTFTNISNLAIQRTDAAKNFPVVFSPKTAGDKTGRIIIVTNLGIDTIFLHGVIDSTGVFTLSQPQLNFDSVSTCLSLTESAYLVNNNCDSVLVTEDLPPRQGSFLRTSPPLPFWLHAGDSLKVTIIYSPKSVGQDLDSVIFLGSIIGGKNRSLTLHLSGFGEPGSGILSYSPKQFDFQSLSICAHDSALGFITNIGCDSLVVDLGVLAGDPDFKLAANSLQITMNSGDTMKYIVYLDPAQKGIRNGYLVFTSNDKISTRHDTVHFTVTVTDGTRILSSSISAADFGSVSVCDERDSLLTLSNTGCDTLVITGYGLSGSGFGTDSKFPIMILPHTDTTIHIFTLLDTAGGKSITTGTLTFNSNSDNTLAPITLRRTFIASARRDLGLYLDGTAKAGYDQNIVTYDIKESPGKSFSGAGIKQITFDLNYNTDLLDFTQGVSSNVTSSDGKSFTISGNPIAAGPNGILATIGFTVYLTKDSTTSINLINVKIDTVSLPCTVTTFSDSGSATFDYNFLCGERSIAGFLGGVMPMRIVALRPNPAQDELQIDLQSAVKQDAQVEILNALGAKVYSDIKNVASGTSSIHLDTRSLSSGVYLVRVGAASQSFVKVK